MQIESLYQLFLDSKRITIDSRASEKGSIFFALKGGNTDGNKFAIDAINNGCRYAIIDNPEYFQGDNFILVDNVLKTLQELAKFHRKKFNIPVIAITGTNGKTTSKELIASVLNKKYTVCSTKGNLNNHIGVPLTILSMKENTQIAVIEMGANHMNEIMELCEIAMPNYGIITNIGKAHLEGFGSFENVIKTKKELYNYILQAKGEIFYNSNNTILSNSINNLKIDAISYGGLDSSVKGDILTSDRYLSLNITIGDFKSDIFTRLIGNYNLENVLSAASIGNYFNVNTESIIDAIEDYVPQNNRSQFISTKKNNIILDAYNANPTSVNAAINHFYSLKLDNKCLILGDMLELGDTSNEEHQTVIDLLIGYKFDQVILVGELYLSLNNTSGITKFTHVEELKQWILKNEIIDSNILIKGSRGIRLEQIVDYL